MVSGARVPQGIRLNPRRTIEVCEGMVIQDAINNAAAQIPAPSAAEPWTILLYPGVWDEVLVMAAHVNLVGMDKEACILDSDHVTIVTMAEGCAIANLTLDVTSDATASGTGIDLNDAACTVEDINIILHRSAGAYANGILEDTDNTAKTIYIRNVRCRMTNNSNERGLVILQANKTVYVENSWIQGSDYGIAVGVSGGAAIASTIYASHNQFEASSAVSRSVFCNGGTICLNGDTIGAVDHSGGRVLRENNGIVTYKTSTRKYEVWAGMSVQDGIDAAAAETTTPAATDPYTVLIHPGIYDEAVAMSSWVNLKGIGPKGSVVIYQNDASIIVTDDNVEISDLTVRLGTPGAGRFLFRDNAGADTVKFTNLILEITAPGAHGNICFYFTGTGSYTIERCSYNIGGTGAAFGISDATNSGAHIHLVDNDFEFANVNATHIFSNRAGTWTGGGNRWAGTCGMFIVSNGTFAFDNDAMICTAAWTNTGSTIMLRNCAIEAPVVAGNLAIVRLKNCSYRAIQRVGTGNIVDESPDLKDAPWHVQRWNWLAALAQSQVSVRGTPLDAGTGQVLLQVVDNVADVEAVESGTEDANALSNKLTPARTPRFITQIAVDSFDPHTTMFFGLRETLGDAVPAATENHAGFIWDGANFKASSDDGVGIQENNLDTPDTDAQIQLEVIVFGGITTVGWVEFYVEGILVETHVTRIPTVDLDWQHLLPTAGAGGGDAIDVTVRGGGVQQCPA